MMPNVKKGDSVKGKVTGVENYGIFLLMDDGYTGLIHISEISDKFVRNVGDYVQVDDVIYAKVIEVDDENKRYKLTIKNYDYREGKSNDIEDVNGFKPLAEKLPEWMREYREKEES
jgi:general stress protein 13